MTYTTKSRGFSAVEAVLTVLVIAALAFAGWFAWHAHKKKNEPVKAATSQHAQTSKQSNQTTDSSEGGKYLVIKEWGVRVALPAEMQGKVAYSIATATDPDTNLELQSAKIFVSTKVANNTVCAVTAGTPVGDVIDSGAQYIRTSTAKPFNAARYKGAMKANVLTAGAYAYHLNYTLPSCADSDAAAHLESLDTALASNLGAVPKP